MSDVKWCGTCGWWLVPEDARYGVYGECHCPLPTSLVVNKRYSMMLTDGSTCPCWKPKETRDE